MVPNQPMQGQNTAMQMHDGLLPQSYVTGGVDDMLIHPTAPHGMLAEQERYYSMPPGSGNNIL